MNSGFGNTWEKNEDPTKAPQMNSTNPQHPNPTAGALVRWGEVVQEKRVVRVSSSQSGLRMVRDGASNALIPVIGTTRTSNISWRYDSRAQQFCFYTYPQRMLYPSRGPGFIENPLLTDSNASRSVSEPLVTLDAPLLKGITAEDFGAFKKARHQYEAKIQQLNAQKGTAVLPASYRHCVGNYHLGHFLVAGWIKGAATINDITEEQIKECVEERASLKTHPSSIRLSDIQKVYHALAGIELDFNIADPSSRVWNLSAKYLLALAKAGQPTLHKTRPHVCIKHIMDCLRPALLKKKMKQISEWRRNELFDSKDYDVFIRQLAETAVEVEALSPGLRARELLKRKKRSKKAQRRARRSCAELDEQMPE